VIFNGRHRLPNIYSIGSTPSCLKVKDNTPDYHKPSQTKKHDLDLLPHPISTIILGSAEVTKTRDAASGNSASFYRKEERKKR
jgi:hypothetical protein